MKICLNKNNEKDIFRNVYGENKESAEDLSGNLYMDINALILKEEEHKRIYEAQSKVVKLFKDMQNIIQAQPTLLEWLGLPEILWTEICKKRISNLTSYGRFDWMIDKEDNLCLLEFNSETPFGWKEAIDYHKNIHKYFNQYVDPNTNMTELLRKSVYKSLNEQGFSRCDRIAIIGDLMDEEELETFEVLKRELKYECEDVFIESIHKLVTMLGEIYLDKGENFYPIDFLQTFYSSEWMACDEPKEEFVKALKTDKVKLINPVSTLITHSKGLFALIWYLYSERGLLKEHSETIENHIPYTSFLEDEFSEDEKICS